MSLPETDKTLREICDDNYRSLSYQYFVKDLVKKWLLGKRAKMQSKEWSLSHAYVFNELLEDLQK